MKKVVPSLWYDTEAAEAVPFYVSLFDNSEITWSTVIEDTPSGDSEQFGFKLAGQDFVAISAGPSFKFNPSISLTVFCASFEEVDRLWEKLVDGGSVLMELGAYPFGERYGWLADRYGLSWQIRYAEDAATFHQKIYPTLLFVNEQYGKAEEAIDLYAHTFKNAQVGEIYYFGEGHESEDPNAILFSTHVFEGTSFLISDSGHPHDFNFNEAISFLVYCEDQEEIDYYWDKLTAVPEAEVCGWLKDKFGISWQIVPREMDEMMLTSDKDAKKRVVQAFLKMKKFDIAELRAAFAGEE